MRLVRAIGAFVALPGIAAFAVPLWIAMSAGHHTVRHAALALALLGLGSVLLLSCVREFCVAGRGTLAPWDAPQHLVTSGPYRFSRNPMYIGVVTILAGWCTLWESRTLVIYTLLLLTGFHLRVLLYEEPRAAREFRARWRSYRERVPRWLI